MHHAWPGPGGHHQPAVVRPARVEHPYRGAIGQAAGRRVGCVHFQQRLALDVAQALHIDKARVEKVARWRRDHGQRVGCRRARCLVIRQVVGQAVQPLRRQPGAEKLALARGRGKLPLRKRCLHQRHRGKALRQQRRKVHGVAIG